MMRYSLLVLSLVAAPASAQTFTVHNPLPVARPDAVIDLPTAAAAQSAVIGGKLYPVQRVGDRLRLVAPVGSQEGQSQVLTLIERAGPAQWRESRLDRVFFVPLKSGVI